MSFKNNLPQHEQTDILLKILKQITIPILIIDEKIDVLFASTGVYSIFNAKSKENIVHTILRSPQLMKVIRHFFSDEIKERATVEHDFYLTKSISATIEKISFNNTSYLQIIFQDKSQLQKAQKQQRDFVSYASHELRTPLTALSGFVDILKTEAGEKPELREKFLNILSEQIDRLKRLTEGLLSLHAIEMNEHIQPQEKIDILSIARNVCTLFTPVAQTKNIAFSFDLTGEFYVKGSSDELSQVFTNLLDNAIKYSEPEKELSINFTLENNMIKVNIIDQGIGISQENLVRITERFYRVTDSKGYKQKGVGLGLSITKHILKRHAGELKIQSSLGSGSTFSVCLPSIDNK